MKISYFDCFSGISGDMMLGALIDLGADINFLRKELEKLNLGNYKIEAKKVFKNGITAVKFNVIEDNKTKKTSKPFFLSDFNNVIDSSKLDGGVKNTVKKIFLKIANAESKIHGKPIDKIHFHEIGAIDTIIDVAGAVICIKKLGIEKIYCSKINVGAGFVEFSHGRFPVPAPAVAEILIGVPIYNNDVSAELVTPTGAAIMTALSDNFGEMPAMKVEKLGYGAGAKDLEQPNVLRIFLGEIDEADEAKNEAANEIINLIETNIDNMNPEIYPYVIDMLLENGALDAYLTNIIMKKGRPAVKLTVLAEANYTDRLCNIIFDETTTLGVRIFRAERKILEREIKTIKTKYGGVRIKISKSGNEIKNIMPEYEDCARIAKSRKISLKLVYAEADKAIRDFNS